MKTENNTSKKPVRDIKTYIRHRYKINEISSKSLNQNGFITEIVIVLAILMTVIILVYMRVTNASA